MGRFPILSTILAVALAAGAALAQQGLIVEPWRTSPPSRRLAAPAPAVMPASGLAPLALPTAESRRDATGAALPSSGLLRAPLEPSGKRWTAPLVQLLVDPWAKQAAAKPRPERWVPQRNLEIVDPWARAAVPPHVASRPSRATFAPPTAIF